MDRNRKQSLRAQRVMGTTQRPRMAVYCSLKHMYVQIIDDVAGHTLAQVSTRKQSLKPNQEGAKVLGKLIAESAKQGNISQVVFDRRTSKYHGRIKALAEAAREGGLSF